MGAGAVSLWFLLKEAPQKRHPKREPPHWLLQCLSAARQLQLQLGTGASEKAPQTAVWVCPFLRGPQKNPHLETKHEWTLWRTSEIYGDVHAKCLAIPFTHHKNISMTM